MEDHEARALKDGIAQFDMRRLESERLTGEALERSLEEMLAQHAGPGLSLIHI